MADELEKLQGAGCRQAFPAYRRWVLERLEPLLSGDSGFWDRFEQKRSLLCAAPEPLASRFRWERPFLQNPVPALPIRPVELHASYGVSRERLLRYERAGLLGETPPRPDGLDVVDLKRLQWLLFLLHELRLPMACLTLLLAQEHLGTGFIRLAEAAAPNIPVHRSRPPAFHFRRNTVQSRQREAMPDVGQIRDLLHDLGNKLHVISGRAQRLRRKLPGNELAEKNLSIILAESQRAAERLGEVQGMIRARSHPTAQRENMA